MQMYTWNPWPLFDELERSMFSTRSPAWPQFDIEDSEDDTILTADLPGMTVDDLEITHAAPDLIIRGERKAKDGRYVQRSRFHGAFERRFRIGESYDPDRISAEIVNGVLTIRLEKRASAKPRRIKLSSGGLAAKVKGLLTGDKDQAA